MRRLKAIYLVPVALVLLIGAGFAFYYFLLDKQIAAVKVAQSDWTSARDACAASEGTYEQSLVNQRKAAQKIFEDYYRFRQVQNQMPAILNVKEVYGNGSQQQKRQGLVYWYKVMGTGQLITELSRWAKGYKLPTPVRFSYTGTLGYEDTFPSAKLVGINFGPQTFRAYGYANLLNQINRQTGYNYFPLVIDTGGKVSIKVDRSDRKNKPTAPALVMGYSAAGYFFTRGWDPMGPDAKKTVDDAKMLVQQNKQPEPHRDEATKIAEFPPVLFYFKPDGLLKTP